MTSVSAWLPFVRATAIGWVPLSKKPMPKPFLKQDKCPSDSKLIINVSGFHFETWRHTVERFPDSLLGSDEKEYFFDPVNKEYFFDRNPDLFRYVLAYYRTGKVHFPRSACAEEFEQEMAFFGLAAADSMGDCCYEEFKDRKKDSSDLSLEQAFMGDEKPKPLPPNASIRQKMRHSFEYPHSNTSGLVFYYVTGFFIAGSVLANVLETVPCPKIFVDHVYPGVTEKEGTGMSCGEAFETELFCVDTACVIIFSMEYILRLYASSDRFQYATSVMSIIDAIAILPYYVGLTLSDKKELSGAFVTLRVFRVFRVFKFSRHSQGLRILGYTLKSCARELGFLLFSLTMAVVIFATVIYYTEKNVPKTEFTSIPEAFWYTIVTMTTLGYGDMVPKTFLGKLVGGICSLSGVLVIALPVPVIVSNFSRIYQQSQRSDKQSSHRKARQQQLNKAKSESLARFMANQRLIHHKLTMYENNLLAMQQEEENLSSEKAREVASGTKNLLHKNSKSCLEQKTPQQYHDKYLQQKQQFLSQDNQQRNVFNDKTFNERKIQNKSQLEASNKPTKNEKIKKKSDNFLTPEYALQLHQEKQLKTQKQHENTQDFLQKDSTFRNSDFSFDIFQLQHHHLLVCLEKSLGKDITDSRRVSCVAAPSNAKANSSLEVPLLSKYSRKNTKNKASCCRGVLRKICSGTVEPTNENDSRNNEDQQDDDLIENKKNKCQQKTCFSVYSPMNDKKKFPSKEPVNQPNKNKLSKPPSTLPPHDFLSLEPSTFFNIEPPTPQTSPIFSKSPSLLQAASSKEFSSHLSIQTTTTQPKFVVSSEACDVSQKYDCGYSTLSSRLTPGDDKKSANSSNVEIDSSFTSMDTCPQTTSFSFTTAVSVHRNLPQY